VVISPSHRSGDYLYDIALEDADPTAVTGPCFARVVNMVRLESGLTVSVDAGLAAEHGATRAVACSQLKDAVAAWVQRQGY
jgi:hypothetical protein